MGEEFGGERLMWWKRRPTIRVTSELDSETAVVSHKVSCKLLEGSGKAKLSFENDQLTDVALLLLTPTHNHAHTQLLLRAHYHLLERNALLQTSLNVGPRLKLCAAHDVNARTTQVSLVAMPVASNPDYSLELTSAVPCPGLSKATLKFPMGELSVEEREKDEEDEHDSAYAPALSLNAILKAQAFHGLCSAHYSGDQEDLNLRYAFKDNKMSFIPSVSLPSNSLSFAFKRRFSPSHKLSYWYNLDLNNWSAVYKQNYGNDFKFKAGYDSEVRLGWASLWVGEENGKAKEAPLKMKIQLMLQVPQDDVKSSALMFRVKKRWDI